MPNFQGKPFTHSQAKADNSDVTQVYGKWNWPAQLVRIKSTTSFGEMKPFIEQYGNPLLPDFEAKNIRTIALSTYFPGKAEGLQIHRALESRIRWVLEQLAGFHEYEIRSIGGYCCRYQNNNSTKKVILQNPSYANALTWYNKRHTKDSKFTPITLGQWQSGHYTIGCLEYDMYERGLDNARWDLISNHSFGSAIDINPPENDLNSNTWDMPPFFVETFLKAGFSWGGWYRRSKDAMHFEYLLPYLSADAPALVFPFARVDYPEPPMRQYFLAETGFGGYYPMGLQGNLHAGVHLKDLASATGMTRAMAPGVIVAARLAEPVEINKPDAHALMMGRTGFVLVRHTAKSSSPSGEVKTISIYALYMHLVRPRELGGNESYSDIAWFQHFWKSRFGEAICLNPESKFLGQGLWLEEALDPSMRIAKVLTKDTSRIGEEFEIFSPDGHRQWVSRPMPKSVLKALEALEKGAVVTFLSPMLTVKPGDGIGIVKPAPTPPLGYGAPAPNAPPDSSLQSGFLHWELFIDSAQPGWIDCMKWAGLDPATFPEITEQREDNLFDAAEIKSILVNKLPQADQELFAKAMAEAEESKTYSEALPDLMQDKLSFAPTSKIDGGVTGLFTYTITVEIANDHGLPPPKAGAPYRILVSFLPATAEPPYPTSKPIEITKVEKRMTFTLGIPAQARGLKLSSESMHLDMHFNLDNHASGDDGRWAFFQKAIQHRFRQVRMSPKTEWQSSTLEAILTKIKEEKRVPADFDFEPIRQMPWYNRPKNTSDPLGETPCFVPSDRENGSESQSQSQPPSLFGAGPGQLPVEGKLSHLHPITATWLLGLLEKDNKLTFVSTEQEEETETEMDPIFWSFIGLSKTGVTEPVTPGAMQIRLAAISSTVANAGSVIFVLKQIGTENEVATEVSWKRGIALVPVSIQLWGEWQLELKGFEGKQPSQTGSVLSLKLPKPDLVPLFTLEPKTKSHQLQFKLEFVHAKFQYIQGLLRFRVWVMENEKQKPEGEGEVSTWALPFRTFVNADKGQALCEVDPGEVYGKLLAAYGGQLTEKGHLLVEPFVVLPNGFNAELYDILESYWNQTPIELEPSQATWADDHVLQSTSKSRQKLKKAEFGKITSTVTLKKKDQPILHIQTKLLGDPVGWKTSKPILRLVQGGADRAIKSSVKNGMLMASIELKESDFGGEFIAYAEVTDKNSFFNKLPVTPVSEEGKTKLLIELNPLTYTIEKKYLVLKTTVENGIPIGQGFKFVCLESTDPEGVKMVSRSMLQMNHTALTPWAKVTQEHQLLATIPISVLKKGASYSFSLFPVNKSGIEQSQIYGLPLESENILYEH